MALRKKYKTPQYGPQGDKAWEKVKEERKMESEYKVKSRPSQSFGKVDTNTNSKPKLSPYTVEKTVKDIKSVSPKTYKRPESGSEYPSHLESTTKTTMSQNKEVVTGNLSTKEPVKVSNTSNSSDKMTWAKGAMESARGLLRRKR